VLRIRNQKVFTFGFVRFEMVNKPVDISIIVKDGSVRIVVAIVVDDLELGIDSEVDVVVGDETT
jgi:hypothetical protein